MFGIVYGNEIPVCKPWENTTKNTDKKNTNKIHQSHHRSIEEACDQYNYYNPSRITRSSYTLEYFSSTRCNLFEIIKKLSFCNCFFLSEFGFPEKWFIKYFFKFFKNFRISFFCNFSSWYIVMISDNYISSTSIKVRSVEKLYRKYESYNTIKYSENEQDCNNSTNRSSCKSNKSSNSGDDSKWNTRFSDYLEIISFESHPEFIRRDPLVEMKTSFFNLFFHIFRGIYLILNFYFWRGKRTSEHSEYSI